ncbi:MAG: magnesium transporter [Candidatus Omnitrophica bacterium 4484_171]|nr:MAG: magnesium transporter [Candidatus Omnitrophica bacterium 4484_171]
MLENNTISQVEELIKDKKFSELKSILPKHPEDIAYLISNISEPYWRTFVFRMISTDKAIEVFEYLPLEEQEDMIKSLTSKEIQNILNEMSPDDRTELFEDMPAELVKRCINLLSPGERKIALQILNYPDDSVGRLITPDFVQLYEDMSVQEALEHIRKVGLLRETVYHCYVIGRDKKLNGVVSLKKIVLSPPEAKIKDVMFKDVIKVNAYTDREEAARIFKKYDLIALPVADNNGKLLGIVTFDDFVDVLEDEATEDFERIAAVLPVEKPYMEAGFFNVVWKRSFWLIILVLLESLSSIVLQKYSGAIQKWIALSFFIPILIDTGGNAGTQSATMIIRGLATGEIQMKDFFRIVFRESLIGVFIGGIMAVIGIIRVFFQQSNWLLSISVGISIGVTIILAAVTGAVLPLIFRKIKLDPALMSGPLITTIVDVGGIFIYFEVASMILGI